MSSNKKSKSSVASTVPELFCICRKPYDENDESNLMMIECESCNDWLHGKCVNISLREAADIEVYICPRCLNGEKRIVYKKVLNNHRYDYSDPEGATKPIQAGTKAFVTKLLATKFPDAYDKNIVTNLRDGNELTVEYLERHGFNKPILIENKKSLQFTMPDSGEIDLTKIENIVGSDYEIDVIDVERQETYPMKISELNEYFKTTPRTKTYNLISFEISKTNLTLKITAPKIVCDLSWASNKVWPQSANYSSDAYNTNNIEDGKTTNSNNNYLVKPEVQKYCLISAGGSYTDFHVDFGGSSVWYHIVKGDKIFYLIEPTIENLKIYEKWLCVKNHSEIFLGDKVKNCYIFKVNEGSTIFLPTGWIHAVYTPKDSLVFGGNFLHSLNIPLQLKVYEMENRLKTPEKFRFPLFETFQWYAFKYHQQLLKEANSNRKPIKAKLLADLKYLRDQLKKWISSKNFYELHDYQIPRQIDGEKLVNMMNRELAKAEVLLQQCDPPNSENSLKIKLKLNPNDLASSTSTLVVDKKAKQEFNSKPKKETLSFKASENIDEIKIDECLTKKEEIKTESHNSIQPPIRLVMKIPKLSRKNLDEPEAHALPNEPIKPIKLKIKTQDMVMIASSSGQNPEISTESSKEPDNPDTESTTTDDMSNNSESEIYNEDDALMNELKNSYQDKDFIYPSLKICGTTARTSKKNKDQTDVSSQLESRKRKLKPHAAEYLENKKREKKLEEPPGLDEHLEKKTQESDTAKSSIENSDDDFNVDDEDDLDYDQEFKIKCEENLKLSKKLKTKSVKHQKKLNKLDMGTAGGLKSVATDPTAAKPSPSVFNISNKKNKKKGYATTKQRLGKLLKLNRLVNI